SALDLNAVDRASATAFAAYLSDQGMKGKTRQNIIGDLSTVWEALRRARRLTLEPEVGKVYEGEVIVVTDFAAIVRLGATIEGRLHVSELDRTRVGRVQDVLKVGDAVRVRLLGVDHMGKLVLSRRAALDADESEIVR
ncbi:MAG TPA: S1 RNA-binding domain-containing protein, partial [Acidobacteriota bacterium]|nr:S1 RNA-binding domain-containing protein [Acidobacteriota bacterium]